MRTIFILLFTVVSIYIHAQVLPEADKSEILRVLEDQRIAWNDGDIELYMNGYWKSDSLLFIGKNGIRYGWNETLQGYKKGYPDKTIMGKLIFEVISLAGLTDNKAFMIGKWTLERKENNVSGYFSLIWKKILGRWLIIVDHSS